MRWSPRRTFIGLWLVLLLLKLWLACTVPLFEDEAWYWLEGQHLAWAYSDLPGLTAWMSRLGVFVGGTTLPGLRWPFLLMGSAIPWLSVRIASRWSSDEDAWRAGMVAMLLPLGSATGLLALPDVPLVFASLLAFDACLALLERVTTTACLQLAIALVLGANSHYRFVFAVAGGLAGLLASPSGRSLLSDRRVLMAMACGALAWLPIGLFNLGHQAAGLRFQFVDRHPWRFQMYGLRLQFIQPLLVGPLLYVAILWVLWQALKRRADPRWALLLGASGLPIALFLVLGPFADVQRVSFHWPLSAYLLALPCLPRLLREHDFARWRGWIVASNAALCAALWLLAIQVVVPGGAVRLARMGFYPKMFSGSAEVAAATRQRLAAMPADTALLGDNFALAARLAFALGGDRRVITLDHRLNTKHGRALQLALWGSDETALQTMGQRATLLVVEEDVLDPERREPWNRHVCALFPGLADAGESSIDGGRQHFVFYRHDPDAQGRCAYPSLAFMRTPTPGATVAGAIDVSGWAYQDAIGVARVEVLLDGRSVAVARYGIEDVEVRSQWPATDDPQQPDVGFAARVDLTGVAAGEHSLELRVTGRDGRVRILENRSVRVAAQR